MSAYFQLRKMPELSNEFWTTHDLVPERKKSEKSGNEVTILKIVESSGGISSGLMQNREAREAVIKKVLERMENYIKHLERRISKGEAVNKVIVNKVDDNVKNLILKLTGGSRNSHHFRNYTDLHERLYKARATAQA